MEVEGNVKKVSVKPTPDKRLRRHTALKFGMIISSILIITLFLPKQPRFRYEYDKGKVWMHENLISPYNFAILKTPAELERDRSNILTTIHPIYDFATHVGEQNRTRFENEFTEKWRVNGMDTLANNPEAYRRVGSELLHNIYQRGVMSLHNRFQQEQENYNFILMEGNVGKQLNSVNVFTIERAWNVAEETLE